MDCAGLAVQWESSAEVRLVCRDKKKLFVHPETQKFCEPTRINAVDNAAVLRPCLRHLAKTPKFQLPHLDPLQAEIALLLDKLGLQFGDQGVYKAAVELKKLLGLVKRRAHRKEVTKENGLSKARRVVACAY
eukprot:Skav229710  [mRNA]  locus=scaffold49:152082:152477:- [translate_table: standard]